MNANLNKLFVVMMACLITMVSDVWAAPSTMIGTKHVYPAFQVGVTGAWVTIGPEQIVKVERVDSGSPAEQYLKPGDLLLRVNDTSLKVVDPRVPLGLAVNAAEAAGGALRFHIEREGRQGSASVRIPRIGGYSESWPLHCQKSERIIRDHADWLAGLQRTNGWFVEKNTVHLNQVLAALFLLSTDDPKYASNVQRFAEALSRQVQARPGVSSWHLGYHLIFLSEYYLKTGDRGVLPVLEALSKLAADHQTSGGWGHGMSHVAPGYVGGGLMNSAGVTVFLGLTLARECGVTVSEEAFQRAVVFFYRMAGRGSIGYGDHRPQTHAASNGRNAVMACAFSLLDQECYQAASKHLAMMVADSYFVHELGHTGGGFNVLWRGVAVPHLPEGQTHRRKRHMEQLVWYYDLCRPYGGGFSMLPSPPITKRYTGRDWGHGLGLTYTAPLRTLRITGAPRTKHSVATPQLEPMPWGNQVDEVLLDSNHAKGYSETGLAPHEVMAKLKSGEGLTPAICANLMRHYNPAIRIQAARRLGETMSEDAYTHIQSALQDPDPRVRRAGCDAISGYQGFRRGGTGIGIPRETVSKWFVPHLETIIHKQTSGWWEIDGALWALAAAMPEDIRRNRDHIDRYAAHSEWYLRESAYWALIGLGTDIRGEEFLSLAKMYSRSSHIFERGSYGSGHKHILKLLKKQGVRLPDEVVANYVAMMGDQLYDASITAGYDEMRARHVCAHRVMTMLNRFVDPPYHLIVNDMVKYMDGWAPDIQESGWMIIGSKSQPGLARLAADLGDDAGPLIERFEYCLKQDYWNLNNKKHVAVYEVMRDAINDYKHRLSDQ